MNVGFVEMGFVLAVLAMFTVVAVVVIWQGLKTARAKTQSTAEIARDEAYRKLAEEAVSVQRKMADDLSDLRARIISMEKMLREVD
jgi:predicted transcriptional regulator